MLGVLVRFTTCPLLGATRKRSNCSFPSLSEAYAIQRPLGDHAGLIWSWLLTVSCVGQPLSADTSQILLRPLRLLMNATCFPSGDQVLSPMLCDMYNLSRLSGCTSNFSLD